MVEPKLIMGLTQATKQKTRLKHINTIKAKATLWHDEFRYEYNALLALQAREN